MRLDVAGRLFTGGLALAGVLGIVGAVLPWVEAPFGIEIAGVEGDGALTLAAAVVLLAIAALRGMLPQSALVLYGVVAMGYLLGGFMLIVAVVDGRDVQRAIDESEAVARLGSGIYLTGIAGGLALLSAFVGTFSKKAVEFDEADDEPPDETAALTIERLGDLSVAIHPAVALHEHRAIERVTTPPEHSGSPTLTEQQVASWIPKTQGGTVGVPEPHALDAVTASSSSDRVWLARRASFPLGVIVAVFSLMLVVIGGLGGILVANLVQGLGDEREARDDDGGRSSVIQESERSTRRPKPTEGPTATPESPLATATFAQVVLPNSEMPPAIKPQPSPPTASTSTPERGDTPAVQSVASKQGISYTLRDDFQLYLEQGGDFFRTANDFIMSVAVSSPVELAEPSDLEDAAAGLMTGMGIDHSLSSSSSSSMQGAPAQIISVAAGGLPSSLPAGHIGFFIVWQLPDGRVILVGGVADKSQRTELESVTYATANSVRVTG